MPSRSILAPKEFVMVALGRSSSARMGFVEMEVYLTLEEWAETDPDDHNVKVLWAVVKAGWRADGPYLVLPRNPEVLFRLWHWTTARVNVLDEEIERSLREPERSKTDPAHRRLRRGLCVAGSKVATELAKLFFAMWPPNQPVPGDWYAD